MKQVIGYMEYDFINIKYGLWYTIIIFLVVGGAFCVRGDWIMATGYMMFGGLIISGTFFNVTRQTVSFTALMPGRAWQKVCGRYLCGILAVLICSSLGVLLTVVFRMAGLCEATIEIAVYLELFEMALIFLSIQNVLLYLLLPVLGVQYLGIVRMVPAFIMFFLVGNWSDLNAIAGWQGYISFPVMSLGVSIIVLVISMAASCYIVKNRDNE